MDQKRKSRKILFACVLVAVLIAAIAAQGLLHTAQYARQVPYGDCTEPENGSILCFAEGGYFSGVVYTYDTGVYQTMHNVNIWPSRVAGHTVLYFWKTLYVFP